jgi:hypothetical protein
MQAAQAEPFARELPYLMYGFGDAPAPLPESVKLLERMMVEYLASLVRGALGLSAAARAQAAAEAAAQQAAAAAAAAAAAVAAAKAKGLDAATQAAEGAAAAAAVAGPAAPGGKKKKKSGGSSKAAAAGAGAAADDGPLELRLEDVLFLLRREPRKVARVRELLEMQKFISEARAAFKEGEEPDQNPSSKN